MANDRYAGLVTSGTNLTRLQSAELDAVIAAAGGLGGERIAAELQHAREHPRDIWDSFPQLQKPARVLR